MTKSPPNEQMEGQNQTSQQAGITHVQTVRVKFDDKGNEPDGADTPENSRYVITATEAIRAAGLDGDSMFRYVPEEVDNLGVVPALGSEGGEGYVRDSRTYSVRDNGNKYASYRLTIPEAVLEALEIDPDPEAAKNNELPMLDVFAGDRMIAFGKSNAIAVPVDALPNDYEGEGDDNKVVLHQIQTAVPGMQSGWDDGVTIAATPAIKQAGGRASIGGVRYLPELSDDLGGDVVPAIGLKNDDGRSDGEALSVYHEGPDRDYFKLPIPADVLDALDLSTDDYENVALDDRPPLTVYAGDRIVALGRPGEREIDVDRSQAPRKPAPTLTDIAGIGPALADELATRGFETVADLADADREELLAIDQLGEKRADRILNDIPRSESDNEREE
jgi:hypothetical protein